MCVMAKTGVIFLLWPKQIDAKQSSMMYLAASAAFVGQLAPLLDDPNRLHIMLMFYILFACSVLYISCEHEDVCVIVSPVGIGFAIIWIIAVSGMHINLVWCRTIFNCLLCLEFWVGKSYTAVVMFAVMNLLYTQTEIIQQLPGELPYEDVSFSGIHTRFFICIVVASLGTLATIEILQQNSGPEKESPRVISVIDI